MSNPLPDSKAPLNNPTQFVKKKNPKQTTTTSYKEEMDMRQNEEIKEVFNLFDIDKKGVINGHNMKICLKTIGVEIPQTEVENLVKEMFHKNIDTTFKYEEFFQIAKKKLSEKNPDLEYEKYFYLLCDYKEGDERNKENLTLNKESLTELAKKVGELMSSEEIEEMIAIVAGEDGNITKNQFIDFMKNPIDYKNITKDVSKISNNNA